MDASLYLAAPVTAADGRTACGKETYDAALNDCVEAGRLNPAPSAERRNLIKRAKIGALLVNARDPVNANPFILNRVPPDLATAACDKAAEETLRLDPGHTEAKALKAKLEPLIYDRTPQVEGRRLFLDAPEKRPKPIGP